MSQSSFFSLCCDWSSHTPVTSLGRVDCPIVTRSTFHMGACGYGNETGVSTGVSYLQYLHFVAHKWTIVTVCDNITFRFVSVQTEKFYRSTERTKKTVRTESTLAAASSLLRWYLIVRYPNRAVPNLRRIFYSHANPSTTVAQYLIASFSYRSVP